MLNPYQRYDCSIRCYPIKFRFLHQKNSGIQILTYRKTANMKNTILIVALTLATIASQAHVTLDPKTATSGGYAKLTFRVPHGCEGSATRKITVQLPEGTLSVKPQVHPGWKISTQKIILKTPAVVHGKSITESISEVTWSGGLLPDEHMDEFGMSVKLPERAGESLVFPVLQECKKGSTHWKEVPTAEHAAHIQFPAPTLLLEKAAARSGH